MRHILLTWMNIALLARNHAPRRDRKVIDRKLLDFCMFSVADMAFVDGDSLAKNGICRATNPTLAGKNLNSSRYQTKRFCFICFYVMRIFDGSLPAEKQIVGGVLMKKACLAKHSIGDQVTRSGLLW